MAGAEQRLAVLLAHLAPAQQQANVAQPGSRVQGSNSALVSNNGPLVIVGGICLDIQAKPTQVEVNRGTSVPGTHGLPIISTTTTTCSHLLAAANQTPPPKYLANTSRGGEVAACVADVAAVEAHLTPERLADSAPQIQQACLLLAEANLSEGALEYVCRTAAAARVPVFIEPVSVPKAARLARSLPYATFVSPNAGELMSMADEVVSCNGAGDTLVAGMVAALLQRHSPQQALAFGMAASCDSQMTALPPTAVR
eukprot:XP_001691769.1 predicted protein [Chlamydomonas reinhardtii]